MSRFQFLYFLDDKILLLRHLALCLLLTGRVFGHTTKCCSITSLGTPDISDIVNANMSEFALRKATSALSFLVGRLALMVTLGPEPLLSSDTYFVAVFSSENKCFFFGGLLRDSSASSLQGFSKAAAL